MQRNIPCDDPQYWDFKQLALDKKMGMKEYLHFLIDQQKNNGGDKK
jgi:hypothetical protein